MKIVIDIPKYIAALCVENNISDSIDIETLTQAIKNGIPLPEHHGRLIDEDALLKYKYPHYISYDFYYKEVIDVTDIADVPTILKADKEM